MSTLPLLTTTAAEPVVIPALSNLDAFVTNVGGDGSIMEARSKYVLLGGENETDPALTLEIYTKLND